MKRSILFLLLVAILLLTACQSQPQSTTTPEVKSEVMVDENGNPYVECPMEATLYILWNEQVLSSQETSYQVRWTGYDGYWELTVVDNSAATEAAAQLNEQVERINSNLAQLYPPARNFFEVPYVYEMQAHEIGYDLGGFGYQDEAPSCNVNPNEQYRWLHLSTEEVEGYVIETRVGDEFVYVTATTPEGSLVEYGFSRELLETALISELDITTPSLTTPKISEGGEILSSSIMKNLFDAANSGEELLVFSMGVEDYEGRRELQPALTQAIKVVAYDRLWSNPVLSMHGYLSGGEYGVTTLSLDTKSQLTSQGTFILGTGSSRTSGSSKTSLEFSQVARSTDFVRGSIFATRP